MRVGRRIGEKILHLVGIQGALKACVCGIERILRFDRRGREHFLFVGERAERETEREHDRHKYDGDEKCEPALCLFCGHHGAVPSCHGVRWSVIVTVYGVLWKAQVTFEVILSSVAVTAT